MSTYRYLTHLDGFIEEVNGSSHHTLHDTDWVPQDIQPQYQCIELHQCLYTSDTYSHSDMYMYMCVYNYMIVHAKR